uniref:Uncharacterized protein n=1 Tax=Anguilla anguilla TaxID=7936 RepID=A0A0E9TVV6_ANGAN
MLGCFVTGRVLLLRDGSDEGLVVA